MIFKLKSGAKFPMGGHTVKLVQDADFDFVDATTLDGVAEMLASDPTLFALHRDTLAHDEEVTKDGKTVKVNVTYGAAGVRQESEGVEVQPAPSRERKTDVKDETKGKAS